MNTTITIHNIKLTSLSNANHKHTNLVILGPHPSASLVSIRIHNCVHETCATSSIKLWILNVNVNYTGHLPMLPHRCLCLQTLWRYIIYTRTRSSAIANRPHDASHCYPHTLHMDGIKFEMTVYIFVSTVFRKKHPLLFSGITLGKSNQSEWKSPTK